MTGADVIGLVDASSLGVSAAVIAAAAVVTRMTHVVLTFAMRRVAAKRLAGESTRWNWRMRTIRRTEANGSLSEIRRQQRINSTALALSRLATVVIWATTAVVLLHVYGISVSVAVSGAGFIGLILALGAQNSVSDYVTGIHVLLEDRFGEGDEIELVTANGRHLRGVVTGHGMFGTRLQADGATHHIANRLMSEVTNHSQLGVATVLDIDHVEALHDSTEPRSLIHLRASRTLGETDRHHFGQQLRNLTYTDPPPEPRPPTAGPTPPPISLGA